MTYTIWVASHSYGEFLSLLQSCAVDLGVEVPRHPQEKRVLESVVRRWLAEEAKPPRKRDKGMVEAGRRFQRLLGYRGVEPW